VTSEERARFSLATSVGLPAAAFVVATTLLAVLKGVMVDAAASGLPELRSGMPNGKVRLMFSYLQLAHSAVFVFQLLACCILAWWAIRLARAIGEKVPLTREAGWYGNVWCLPIANLWLPFVGLRELWRGTGRYSRGARWLFGSAWAAWVGHLVLCILAAIPFEPGDTAAQSWIVQLGMIRDSVFVAGSMLGIMVVVWLTTVQARALPK
jgi:hypothetical protein